MSEPKLSAVSRTVADKAHEVSGWVATGRKERAARAAAVAASLKALEDEAKAKAQQRLDAAAAETKRVEDQIQAEKSRQEQEAKAALVEEKRKELESWGKAVAAEELRKALEEEAAEEDEEAKRAREAAEAIEKAAREKEASEWAAIRKEMRDKDSAWGRDLEQGVIPWLVEQCKLESDASPNTGPLKYHREKDVTKDKRRRARALRDRPELGKEVAQLEGRRMLVDLLLKAAREENRTLFLAKQTAQVAVERSLSKIHHEEANLAKHKEHAKEVAASFDCYRVERFVDLVEEQLEKARVDLATAEEPIQKVQGTCVQLTHQLKHSVLSPEVKHNTLAIQGELEAIEPQILAAAEKVKELERLRVDPNGLEMKQARGAWKEHHDNFTKLLIRIQVSHNTHKESQENRLQAAIEKREAVQKVIDFEKKRVARLEYKLKLAKADATRLHKEHLSKLTQLETQGLILEELVERAKPPYTKALEVAKKRAAEYEQDSVYLQELETEILELDAKFKKLQKAVDEEVKAQHEREKQAQFDAEIARQEEERVAKAKEVAENVPVAERLKRVQEKEAQIALENRQKDAKLDAELEKIEQDIHNQLVSQRQRELRDLEERTGIAKTTKERALLKERVDGLKAQNQSIQETLNPPSAEEVAHAAYIQRLEATVARAIGAEVSEDDPEEGKVWAGAAQKRIKRRAAKLREAGKVAAALELEAQLCDTTWGSQQPPSSPTLALPTIPEASTEEAEGSVEYCPPVQFPEVSMLHRNSVHLKQHSPRRGLRRLGVKPKVMLHTHIQHRMLEEGGCLRAQAMMDRPLPQRLMGGVHNQRGLQHQPMYQVGFPAFRFQDANRGSLLGFNAGDYRKPLSFYRTI